MLSIFYLFKLFYFFTSSKYNFNSYQTILDYTDYIVCLRMIIYFFIVFYYFNPNNWHFAYTLNKMLTHVEQLVHWVDLTRNVKILGD